MGKLVFKEEGHEYFWDGVPVPSATGILKAVGLSKDFGSISDFYKERGIATHKAIELSMTGMLDEESVDPVIRPYFDGAMKFLETMKFPPTSIEKALYSEEYGFAGTIDVEFPDIIVDWKTSKSPDPVSELQGEAYKILVAGMPYKEFIVVQLPGDGSFKAINYGRKVDTFPSVLKCFQWWRKAHPRTKI